LRGFPPFLAPPPQPSLPSLNPEKLILNAVVHRTSRVGHRSLFLLGGECGRFFLCGSSVVIVHSSFFSRVSCSLHPFLLSEVLVTPVLCPRDFLRPPFFVWDCFGCRVFLPLRRVFLYPMISVDRRCFVALVRSRSPSSSPWMVFTFLLSLCTLFLFFFHARQIFFPFWMLLVRPINGFAFFGEPLPVLAKGILFLIVPALRV